MTSLSATEVAGVILAGGLSRRMGGGDKGLAPLGSMTMLDRVIRVVRPQVGALVLNANGDPTRFAATGLPVAADTIEGFVGPLAGVLAGMRWASRMMPVASHVLSVSSDAPFLPADLLTRLSKAIEARPAAIAIARSPDGLHPVIGLWPISHADDLEASLRAGLRKVLDWTDRHGTVPVDFPLIEIGGEMVDPFFNVNTPAELDEARRLLARLAP
jgi:molybdopterin-guanine dinucleotide biosynthesis protein A